MQSGDRRLFPKSYEDRIVGQCETITCVQCKKSYEPTVHDIYPRNQYVYYKTCYICRQKNFMKRLMKNKYITIIDHNVEV